MPSLSQFARKDTYHILLLALLLGVQFYQSFFSNITSYRALPRAQFRVLQASIWPMYFRLQTALAVAIALTAPGLVGENWVWQDSVRMERLRTTIGPLALMVMASAINRLVFAPITAKLVLQRKFIETKQTKGQIIDRYQREKVSLDRWFLVAHSLSYVGNSTTLLASFWYALCCLEQIQPIVGLPNVEPRILGDQ